jgi:hypothetical protein
MKTLALLRKREQRREREPLPEHLLKYLRIRSQPKAEPRMQLDLSDEEARALLNVLVEVVEADRYPNSPRIRLLQEILAKCGEVGGLPPELAARVRRYAPPPPAKWPTPEERDPSRRARQGRRTR